MENIPSSQIQVIPCGIDLDLFQLIDRALCRERLGWQKMRMNPGRIEARETVHSVSVDHCARLLSQFYAQMVGGEGVYLRRRHLPLDVNSRFASEAIPDM